MRRGELITYGQSKVRLRHDIELFDMQRGISLDNKVAPQDMPQFLDHAGFGFAQSPGDIRMHADCQLHAIVDHAAHLFNFMKNIVTRRGHRLDHART